MQDRQTEDPTQLSSEAEHPELVACVFWVKDKEFSVDVTTVVKVLESPEIVPMPLGPEYISGITSLLGDPVPVVDLSVIYGLSEDTDKDSHEERFVVVVDTVNGMLGLLSTARPDLRYEFSGERIDVNELSEQYRLRRQPREG